MKDQNQVRIALEIWNLINKLGELLWDRYEESSSKSTSNKKMTNSFATIKYSTLPGLTINRKTNPESNPAKADSQGKDSNLLSPAPFTAVMSLMPGHLQKLLYIRTGQLTTCAFQGSFLTSTKGLFLVSGEAIT